MIPKATLHLKMQEHIIPALGTAHGNVSRFVQILRDAPAQGQDPPPYRVFLRNPRGGKRPPNAYSLEGWMWHLFLDGERLAQYDPDAVGAIDADVGQGLRTYVAGAPAVAATLLAAVAGAPVAAAAQAVAGGRSAIQALLGTPGPDVDLARADRAALADRLEAHLES